MRRRLLPLSLCLCLFAATVVSAQEPALEVARILDAWTSFRWGQDCLVWVVHYPQELVDPWVRVEGSRQGFSPYEMETSAQSFRKSLRMDEALAFLLSVYNFGSRPVQLGPVEKRLFLELPDGRRIAPLSFEERLASPIEGLVQGLVFFPRQEEAFSLVLTGLGPAPETRFDFAGRVSGGEIEELVVELPPLPQEPQKAPSPPDPVVAPSPAVASPPVGEPSTTSDPAFEPPPPFLLLPSDPLPLKTEATVAAPDEEVPPVVASEEPLEVPAAEVAEKEPPFRSREETLETFLRLWSAGETGPLYRLLSDESRLLVSEETFAREALSRSFRLSLRDGYRTTWLDENKVKVTAAQKLVFVRVLQSETFRLVRQEGGWRVVW